MQCAYVLAMILKKSLLDIASAICKIILVSESGNAIFIFLPVLSKFSLSDHLKCQESESETDSFQGKDSFEVQT